VGESRVKNEMGVQKKAEELLQQLKISQEDLLLQERMICSVSLSRTVAENLSGSCKNGGEDRVK
jgi:hypothetical protein